MRSVAIGLHSGKLIAVLATLFAGVAAALSVPPLRSVIEQSMAWHMVFQMPLLVLAGALAYLALPPRSGSRRLAIIRQVNQFNHFGLTSFMAAQVIIAYWMLPWPSTAPWCTRRLTR